MIPTAHARRFLVVLVVAALVLAAVIVSPFWEAFAVAAVLAAALSPAMEWISARLGGRRSLAAVLLTLAVLLAVVLPIAGVGTIVVRDFLAGFAWFREVIASEGVTGLLRRLPGPLESAVRRILDAIPDPQQALQRFAGQQGGQAAGAVRTVLTATGGAVFQAAMMLIALFFFLADGHKLVDWLDGHVPLGEGRFRRLLEEFRKTSVSVLWATLATASIQTVTALVGYVIARAPSVVFLTVATFVSALVPALGATFMIVAAGVLQLATGHLLSGSFLLLWGIGVVAIVDNVARPYLLKGGMALNGGVIFFALLGGIAVFGAIGFIVGPLIVTFLVTVLSMYEREFGSERGGPDPSA